MILLRQGSWLRSDYRANRGQKGLRMGPRAWVEKSECDGHCEAFQTPSQKASLTAKQKVKYVLKSKSCRLDALLCVACVHMCPCRHVRRSTVDVRHLPLSLSTLVLSQGLLLSLARTCHFDWTGLPASSRESHLHYPATGTGVPQACAVVPRFYVGLEDPNSDHHTYITSTLVTEPSP